MADNTERPEPYVWMAYIGDVDKPMMMLPLDSTTDSEIWEDDGVEIEILWWGDK